MNIEKLEQAVIDWAEERGIFEHSDPKSQALKTMSEVGEFADNVLKGRDCRDDIGDILVTLVLQCKMQDTSLEECLLIAFNEISNRKGTMIGGAFVKEGDNA